jgi:hypothetical protein
VLWVLRRTGDTAASEVQANYRWTDKQISSRSEYREYAAPTAAPPTTMAALRANSPSSNQSLLGTGPTGSTLVQESNHSTFYASPLSDVTKTVQHWIAAYESDGSPDAAPILYRYLEQASVNVSAWVEKVGYVFNGSSTLRSKSTFTESDQGTTETYRGLERQEPNSFNNWTVTYAPVETHTGGITQTITHSKPAADNTITLPGQGTHSTVAPGGEHHAGTSTLATYLTVQQPLAEFVGHFSTKTGYVSASVTSTSDGGVDGSNQTVGNQTQEEAGAEGSLSLADLPNLSDAELENVIKLFFYMYEGLTPDFAAFQAMSQTGFIQIKFYRSSRWWLDTQNATDSRDVPGGRIFEIYLDRSMIERDGIASAVQEFKRRLERANDPYYGDRAFRAQRKLYSDSLNQASLGATPSANNSAAQDAYFYQLPEENRRALATAAAEAEAALRTAGESAELVIRVTPQGGVVLAVIDVPRQGITWQTTVNLGLAGAGLGVAAIVNRLKATNNGAKAISVVQNAPVKGLVDNVAVKGIKAAGVFNHTVKSLDDALATIRKAMPDAVELPRAVAGQPYPSPPPGVKKWFQIHPPEPGVGNNLPHIKFADWTNGKKGTGGSWGHIFFPE